VELTLASGTRFSAAAAVDGSKIGMSWLGNRFERGYAFEKYVASELPASWKLPERFKTFDFFGEGKAISVKTLDTNTLARIAKPETVRYTVNWYINKMLDFTEYRHLKASKIISKELRLAIPANTSSMHMQQIMRSVQYGSDNGVKVVITKVK
ncbi:MAG: hypothetical protein LBO73_01970, partial [Holosporaceae bacterium]|nr:hypothetical protein [Holosporaceae bacterium]